MRRLLKLFGRVDDVAFKYHLHAAAARTVTRRLEIRRKQKLLRLACMKLRGMLQNIGCNYEMKHLLRECFTTGTLV